MFGITPLYKCERNLVTLLSLLTSMCHGNAGSTTSTARLHLALPGTCISALLWWWAAARPVMSSRLLFSARLCAVYPGIWGSSGMVCRYLSNLLLKQSTEQPLVLRISAGSVLNSRCPCTGRLACSRFWTCVGVFLFTLQTTHPVPQITTSVSGGWGGK